MYLQQLEVASANTGDLYRKDAARVRVEMLLSGLTGAMLGFVTTLVGAALGSGLGHQMLFSLAASLLFAVLGCFYARLEHSRGDQSLAEFVLSATQAGVLTGLLTFLSLACESLLLLPVAFVCGMLLPTLAFYYPAKA